MAGLAVKLLVLVASLGLALPATAGERLAGWTHVLDGDTIVIDGIHVGLKGVAAPEVARPQLRMEHGLDFSPAVPRSDLERLRPPAFPHG